MKRIVIIILSLLNLMVFHGRAGTIPFRFTMDTSKIQVINQEGEKGSFTEISHPDLEPYILEGEDVVPYKVITFSVPTYCNDIRVKILRQESGESIDLISPLHISQAVSTNGEKMPDMTIDSHRPISGIKSSSVKIIDEYFLNGAEHLVKVGIFPVMNNPDSLSLTIFADIEFELYYKDCEEEDMQFNPIIPFSKESLESERVVSGSSKQSKVARVLSLSEESTFVNAILNSQLYVILVPQNLRNEIGELVAWKRQKGYKVMVETFEDILSLPAFKVGSNSTCCDAAASIRKWLRTQYSIFGTFQCLIIGDYKTSAPIRRFYTLNDGGSFEKLSDPKARWYVPTDAYFSDLVTNWPLIQSPTGEFTFLADNAPFSPTISVGRLLCSTAEEVKTYIDKLKLYEIWPGRGNPNYLNNALHYRHHDANIYQVPSLHPALTSFTWFTMDGNTASVYENLTPKPATVINAMNNCGFYTFQTHGVQHALTLAHIPSDETPKYKRYRMLVSQLSNEMNGTSYGGPENMGLDSLSNEDTPAIMYSLACDIAPFDNFVRFENIPVFARAFTTSGKYGGVALLGNSRVGFWHTSSVLEEKFGQYVGPYPYLGIAENLSKKDQPSPYVSFVHNIIGDPDLMLWRKVPLTLFGNETLNGTSWTKETGFLNGGTYGIIYGSNICRGGFSSDLSAVSSKLSTIMQEHPTVKLGVLTINERYSFPYTQLITTGLIENQTEKISLIYLTLGQSNNSTYKPFLNIGQKGNIYIECYHSLISDTGIRVEDGGKLRIVADRKAGIRNDSVKSGGTLIVEAGETEISGGFQVELGGAFEIIPRTEKL